MKARVAATLPLVLTSAAFAVWSHPAMAENIVEGRAQTSNRLAPSHKLARNSKQSPGLFQSVCITDRGLTCNVTSRIPILPDSICHCGPNIGATLSPSQ
jgi:hypothetical protein